MEPNNLEKPQNINEEIHDDYEDQLIKRLMKENPGYTYDQVKTHVSTDPKFIREKMQREGKIENLISSGQVSDRQGALLFLKKEEVDQWRKEEDPITGIYTDYLNEFAKIVGFGKIDRLRIAEKLKAKPMEKYVDRYNNLDYLITDKNREAVSKLDEIVNHINSIWTDPNIFSDSDVERISAEINQLVYGE